MKTVYISIGNSDDKLTQAVWAEFCADVIAAARCTALHVHGIWYSPTASKYQNMCMCVDVDPKDEAVLLTRLKNAREAYKQDSIAYATASTEFI